MTVDLIVPPDCPPTRLDRFVVSAMVGVSRRRLRDLSFRLNGRLAKAAAIVHPGDVVSVPAALAERPSPAPSTGPALPVLHQDEALVAVDKRAGMSSVALRADETDTVANFLVSAFPELVAVGRSLEAGLVHRLDRGTSGVLLAARTTPAHEALRAQFAAQAVEKEYLALVEGVVAEAGTVSTPIAHDPHRSARMLPCPERAQAEQLAARPAVTVYAPVLRLFGATLVRVSMRSGVRHQVRVHLASAGHPILGDVAYGRESPLIARQALHACRVSLRHPLHGGRLSIESPLPRDMEQALRRLRRR